MGGGRIVAAGAIAAWLSIAAVAQAGEAVVRSGPIVAEVTEDPWRLELTDARGEPILSEHPGTGAGPSGALGFRSPLGWSHATRVISSSARDGKFEALLETTDPLRTIAIELEPAGRGVISLDARIQGPASGVQAVGMGFVAGVDERYLGFGERSNGVDQRGVEVENYVADGPYQDEEYAGISAFVPPWGLREGRPDVTYYPIPWLLSSRGYGVLADNPETSTFRLGTDTESAWSVEVTPAPPGEPGAELAPPPDRLQLRFFAGPRPADALRRFSAAVGRQPRARAPWLYGPWFQPGNDAADLATLRDADAPVSVFQTYAHYLPCGEQQTERERTRTAAAHEGGVAITTYFNPMVCVNHSARYNPAANADALTETRAGSPYNYRYGANTDDLFLVGQYDFFEEAGRELYADALLEAIGDGYDGWMEDFGEYTPLDSVSAEEIDGSRAHNPYATRYHCAAWRAVKNLDRPIVRFQRSGWTGAARCAQVVWGGDPTTGWGFDGLQSSVKQALSAGTSGIGIWGSDIGGFFALGSNRLSPELLKRWVQFGAVSGVMRTQRNGVALPPKNRPQVTDPDQIENWRRYAKLRTQLYPYIVAAEAEYRRTGLPLMRHLILRYPADTQAAAREDEFLFGPDLLAAPVVEEGATERDVYLPRGRWVDLWRSARYDPDQGGLELGRAEVLSGPGDATVPAPLEELPLFVRAGSVLPLLPSDVDTLARPGEDPATVGLADRRRRVELLAFPGEDWRGGFNRRGTISSRTGPRAWRLEVTSPKRKQFDLTAALSTTAWAFEPCSVSRNGERIPGADWTYDPGEEVLTTSFAGRRAVLRVRGGC
jgi:alpha-glucosidase (family GH31 glycosyl hydrolase)